MFPNRQLLFEDHSITVRLRYIRNIASGQISNLDRFHCYSLDLSEYWKTLHHYIVFVGVLFYVPSHIDNLVPPLREKELKKAHQRKQKQDYMIYSIFFSRYFQPLSVSLKLFFRWVSGCRIISFDDGTLCASERKMAETKGYRKANSVTVSKGKFYGTISFYTQLLHVHGA